VATKLQCQAFLWAGLNQHDKQHTLSESEAGEKDADKQQGRMQSWEESANERFRPAGLPYCGPPWAWGGFLLAISAPLATFRWAAS